MAERDNQPGDQVKTGEPTTLSNPAPNKPTASGFKHEGHGVWTNPDGWTVTEQHHAGAATGWVASSPDNETQAFWPKGGDGWEISRGGSGDPLAGLDPTGWWQKSLE
jgi:hypothetical protein